MRVKTKIILILFLAGFLRSGQACAQSDAIQTLRRQFETSSTQGLREKLYVQTDKNFYTPGEVIWFKVYAVDGIFNKPLDLSKATYVEILDKDHRRVLAGKIPMNDGSGSGSFTIPASINSGNYLFRAYTNWMKNYGADLFFEKTLTVVNSLKKPDWVAEKTGVNYDIQFLPEGGQLVNGIESRVAFKAINKKGKGINCSGFILDRGNDTVSHFKTRRFGMGRLTFLPLPANEYRAFIRFEDGTIAATSLPEIHTTGFVLKCEDTDKTLVVTVSTNEQSLNPDVYLLVHTRQVIKSIKAATITNGKAQFTIDKDLLGDGISDIIIFNDQLKPVCERLYFKRPTPQLKITLETDKTEYTRRDKVNLQLQTTSQLKTNIDADLSMSVYLLDSVQTYSETDIMSYLWLSSELRGHIEDPAYYFNSTDPEAAEVADDLMMTQGWRSFRLDDVEQRSFPEFVPETDGSYARGRIVNKQSGLPVAGVRVYLSVPRQHYFFTSAVTDTEGRVNFNINNLYGNNEMVVQTAADDSGKYRIEVNNPFSNKYSSTELPRFFVPEHFTSQLQTHSLSSQVQVAYMGKEQQRYLINYFSDSSAFFGQPDGKYFLDDYTRFKTMEEVTREYVKEVRMRKKDGVFRYTVKNTPYQSFFDLDPLILLDGIPVLKQEEMAEFDPLKIKTLEVVARKFYTGQVAHFGIVSYSTYDGDLAGFQLPSTAIVTDHTGFLYERSFYSPVYETEKEISNRLPDFRNVLEWEPRLKTKDGKQVIDFYTSDLPGKYLIVVEGISKEGSCGSATEMITVKK